MRQFAVIGLGRFGYAVAETLIKKGFEVLAIDNDEGKIESVSDFATYAVQCDATDEKALKAVSTQNVDVAVVSIGENIEASILIVMTLKDLGVKEIVAKAVTAKQGKVLENLGVHRIIYPERDAAIRLAHSLITPNILEHLELGADYSIIEIPVPTKMVGKRLKDSQVRSLFDVNIIAIRKKNNHALPGKETPEDGVNFNPSADETLQKDDVLILIGKEENLERLSTYQ